MTFRDSSDCGARSALAAREGDRGERRRRRESFPNQNQPGEFHANPHVQRGKKRWARETRYSTGQTGFGNFAREVYGQSAADEMKPGPGTGITQTQVNPQAAAGWAGTADDRGRFLTSRNRL